MFCPKAFHAKSAKKKRERAKLVFQKPILRALPSLGGLRVKRF
jgi:hypothetical protein